MTQSLFAGALALALAASPVAALEHSHDGSGQAVLLPYYSVHAGMSTVFAVTNHSDEAKAVRVVLAEGHNGRVGLSFNVYLAARDSWSAAIVGDNGSPPGLPRVFTADSSCTSAAWLPDGVPMRTLAYTDTRADGLRSDAVRLYDGQIEFIEMGTVTGTTAALVEAENCNALRLRFQQGGAWRANINDDIGTPSGGLSGEAQLVDVANGVAFNTEPFVIENFSRAPRHGNGSIDFDAIRIFDPTAVDDNEEFVVDGGSRVSGQRPADAVSLMLMASELEAGFTISDAVEASTRFVVTFPTRGAYLDNLAGGELAAGTPPITPFNGLLAGTAPPYCLATTWRTIDRDGDLGATSELPLCKQVNVVDIIDETTEPGRPGTTFTSAIDQGRIRVGLQPQQRTLVYSTGPNTGNAFAYGLPALGLALTEVRNRNAQPGVLASYAISGRVVRKQEGVIDF